MSINAGGGEAGRSFCWGAATSSHQVEGDNRHNDWWAWESQGHCEGGARSGKATDHWNRYQEDLDLAVQIGLNSYRFSVEWSRIEPSYNECDESALDWYENLIAECEKRSLMPMLTLHHFTSPRWFAEAGGFTNPEAPELFVRYTKKVIERVGARVPIWCTINEPMVLVSGSYLGKFMPPAEYSPKKASLACRGLLRSHALAYDAIHSGITRRSGPWADRKLEVGFAHNMLDFRPDRKWHPIESAATALFRRFFNRAWLDGVTGRSQCFGIPGFLPAPPLVTEAFGRKTCDFIGINYYTKAYVQWRPKAASHERPAQLPLGLSFARRKESASDMEWAVHPQGLGRVLRFASRYGLPIYITENGIADREDRLRADYIRSHLEEVARAIEKGIDIRGYYYWSLTDNFEWIKGFGPRFGLCKIDYDTYARTLNPSARVLSEWIKSRNPASKTTRPEKG